jgi:hypothetical protein
MTRNAQRSELAAIVHKTIRSRPLGDVVELAHAIIDDIEDAGWTIAKASAAPIWNGNDGAGFDNVRAALNRWRLFPYSSGASTAPGSSVVGRSGGKVNRAIRSRPYTRHPMAHDGRT